MTDDKINSLWTANSSGASGDVVRFARALLAAQGEESRQESAGLFKWCDGCISSHACAMCGKCQIQAAPAPQDGNERAAFDTWARNDRMDCCMSLEGHYTDYTTAYAWSAWRARAALASNKAAAVAVDVGDLFVDRGAVLRVYDFYKKHALGSLAAPSCLACGKSTQDVEVAIKHMELPDIVVCAECRSPAPIASTEEVAVEVRVHLTKGGLEVSEPVVEFSKAFESRMDAEPGKVFKLFTHPAAAQPSRVPTDEQRKLMEKELPRALADVGIYQMYNGIGTQLDEKKAGRVVCTLLAAAQGESS